MGNLDPGPTLNNYWGSPAVYERSHSFKSSTDFNHQEPTLDDDCGYPAVHEGIATEHNSRRKGAELLSIIFSDLRERKQENFTVEEGRELARDLSLKGKSLYLTV